MKKSFVAASLALVPLLIGANAMAADVTLKFNGQVSSETCTIANMNNGAQVEVLPKVSIGALARQGDVAGVHPFSLGLSGCTGSKVTTRFNVSDKVDPTTGALKNTVPGGSTAQVQLLNSKYQPINLHNNAGTETVTIVNNTATLSFFAQYLAASDDTTAGDVRTEVLVDLDYE